MTVKLRFFLLCFALQVCATGYSQRVTYSGKEVPLATIFSEIRHQTDYAVFYKNSLLTNTHPVTLSVRDMMVDQLLAIALKGQGLTYTIENKTIWIRRPDALSRVTDHLLTQDSGIHFITVTGKVTDDAGTPLPGATIAVKSTRSGATTNGAGEFVINHVPENAVLSISSVGYMSKDVPVNKIAYPIMLAVSPAKLDEVQGAIPAVIPEDQVLVNGATVKLRLAGEVYIGGVRVPKDQPVYGVGTLKGERLTVTVSDIRMAGYVLPVNLPVYNLDGIEGIYVPGAITRDVAKQSAVDLAGSYFL